MDRLLLEELQHTLGLLSEARANIEGNAALLRSVNTDLTAVLRRLQARCQQQDDASPASSKSTKGGLRTHVPQAPTYHHHHHHHHHHHQQQQQQQQQALPSFRAPPRLPADVVHLQQQYTSLQEGAGPTNSPAGASITSSAAAGFLHSLESVYGHQQQQQQQQQQQGPPAPHADSVLAVQAFADQAYFIGLVAAVLSVMQALTTGSSVTGSGSTQASRPESAQLRQTVPVLLQQCEQWLQAHKFSEQQQQQQQQTLGTDGTAEQHAEVVRWRNRALRSIAATASTATGAARHPAADLPRPAAPAPAPASAGTKCTARAPPGVWLPDHCFDPLNRSLAAQSHQSGNRTQSSSRQATWKVLLPQPSVEQQQQQQQQPVLTYSEVSEVVQYSRQLQKIQQLQLQLAVESQAAPQLLHLLLQCCQQLQQQTIAAHTGASGSSVTHDRCCALYRLLCAMAAGPVKERGLGAGCQLAVEAEVPDDRLPGW